jgi:4-methyl-5(b-hydroxyethyl)-thiazole monophosphate biosynthesis
MARVLVPVADGSEELEAVTLIDLLRRAEIEVVVASPGGAVVTGSRGTRLVPDQALESALESSFELVVLPGGLPGADRLAEHEGLRGVLQGRVARGQRVAAICAAPRVLARAGLLEGRRVTCFPGALEGFEPSGGQVTGTPLEEDGPILTSRGPGTAMDFALRLIEVLAGEARRAEVESRLVRP